MALATSLAHVLSSIDADDVVVIDLRDRSAPEGRFDAAIVSEGSGTPVDATVVIELPGAGPHPELRITVDGATSAHDSGSAEDLLDALDELLPVRAPRTSV